MDALARHGIATVVVEYGVDDLGTAASANDRNDTGSSIKIALLASIEHRKGQDLAVRGMRLLDAKVQHKAELTLYGRTLAEQFFKEVNVLASDLPCVKFGGELDYSKYRSALSQADIVLVCSRDDTLPLVSLDALAMGKAVVCSATTGTSRYLEHGHSAMILEKNSPEEIAKILTHLIDDADLRRKIGDGARKVFERNFTYDAFGLRVLERLNNLVKDAD